MNLGQDDRDPTGRFVRGLTLGALLGAIIAGSSIWSRARARRAPLIEPPSPDSLAPPNRKADGEADGDADRPPADPAP